MFSPADRMSDYIASTSLLWTGLAETRQIVERQKGARVRSAEPFMRIVIAKGAGATVIDVDEVAASRK